MAFTQSKSARESKIMKNTRKGDGRRTSEKYRAVNLFNNRSTRLWNITWLEELMKQLKQGVTHHITPLVRPSPCAWGQPHHPDKYHSIMDSCFGFVRPQQYSVAYTCQNFLSFAYERSAKFLRCTIFCSIIPLRRLTFQELVGSEGVMGGAHTSLECPYPSPLNKRLWREETGVY